jgi:hypothetical protein
VVSALQAEQGFERIVVLVAKTLEPSWSGGSAGVGAAGGGFTPIVFWGLVHCVLGIALAWGAGGYSSM